MFQPLLGLWAAGTPTTLGGSRGVSAVEAFSELGTRSLPSLANRLNGRVGGIEPKIVPLRGNLSVTSASCAAPQDQHIAWIEVAQRGEELIQFLIGDDASERIPQRALLIVLNVRPGDLVLRCPTPQRASLLVASCHNEVWQVAIEDARSVADEEIVERIWVRHSQKLRIALALLIAEVPDLSSRCHVSVPRGVSSIA